MKLWFKIWLALALAAASQALALAPSFAQNRLVPVRTAYSALSAGIGTLWLTQEEGYFKKHGLDSNLIYIRGGSTAVQALLSGEIQFGHLSPAPMLTAWAQGADFVWIGTTTHQMVFTLIVDTSIVKGPDLTGKKIGITRIGSASDLALRTALEQFALGPKDVTMIALGGIPEILAAMRAGAVNGGILSPPTSTAAHEMGYRPLLHIPDLGREFTFSGIAAKRSFVQSQPEIARAYMASLTDGAKVYKEDGRAALQVLRKYLRAEDRILEGGYKEYSGAISSPPYPGLKGLEAVRDSLLDSTPQLRNADLRKFVDNRFVRAR
ncbi:MAG TPA: ABC transporter substrate-binding protein [Candidatus Binatia bacterium]|nr:ABC transporter substrate-binding protein [Candidatus Binatia bacterium]